MGGTRAEIRLVGSDVRLFGVEAHRERGFFGERFHRERIANGRRRRRHFEREEAAVVELRGDGLENSTALT